VLVVGTASGDVAIDGGSGALIAGGPGTVATPDGDRLFRAAIHDGRTVVTTIDPRSGITMGSTSVHGKLELTVASSSGRSLALLGRAPVGSGTSRPGLPMPRASTPIAVVDPSGTASPDRFVLDGNFEPEAFSIDEDRLFLIQYLPAEAPAVYRVTVLDLATGDVRPVAGRFKTPPERMPGVRLGQVYDPTTDQVYTLYSNQPGAYASGYGRGQEDAGGWPEETFVHVLNLRKGWAYCAGVPESMWGGDASEQAIAPSPDGRWLYIVDARRGLIAVMDTGTLDIVRTARVDLGSAQGERVSVAVSGDGETLFVATGGGSGTVAAVDADDLTVRERWPTPVPVSGLGISLDGSSLYAAGTGRIAAIDPLTGEARTTLATPVVEPIVDVDPLPGALAG
jgi:hypothetical protein